MVYLNPVVFLETMATSYQADRAFTEYVHQHLALPQVYQRLGWSPFRLTPSETEQLDRDHGIDRIFYTAEGHLVSVQERFRAGTYATKFNDITLRYRRDHNRHATRQRSEFFKIRADYLLYGMVDGVKEGVPSVRTFQKVVLLNIPKLLDKLVLGEMAIREEQSGKSYWEDDKMIVPVNHNRDRSSSFVVFDVPIIHQHWPGEIIVRQHGFVQPKRL